MDAVGTDMDFDFHSFRFMLRGGLRPWLDSNNDELFRALQREMGDAFRAQAGVFARALPYVFRQLQLPLPEAVRHEWSQNWFGHISGHYTRLAQPLLDAKSFCPQSQGLSLNISSAAKMDFYTRFAASISAAWMSKTMFFMQSDASFFLKTSFLMQQLRSIASLIVDTALHDPIDHNVLVILQRAYMALTALYLEIHNKFPDQIDKNHLRLQKDGLIDFPLAADSKDAETQKIRTEYIEQFNKYKEQKPEPITRVMLVNQEVEEKTAINEIMQDVVLPLKEEIDDFKKTIGKVLQKKNNPSDESLTNEEQDVLIDSKEVCRMLDVSASTLNRLAAAGKLEKKYINSAVRYEKKDVLKLLEKK